MSKKPVFDSHAAKIVAATANVDVRTLQRAVDGHAPRSSAIRDAIVRALQQHKFFDQAKKISAGAA